MSTQCQKRAKFMHDTMYCINAMSFRFWFKFMSNQDEGAESWRGITSVFGAPTSEFFFWSSIFLSIV